MWTGRGRWPATFHLTQVITGHGCIDHYLHRICRLPGPGCWYCPHGDDIAEHTVFACPRWDTERKEIWEFIPSRDVRPDDTLDLLCGPDGLNDGQAPGLSERRVQPGVRGK